MQQGVDSVLFSYNKSVCPSVTVGKCIEMAASIVRIFITWPDHSSILSLNSVTEFRREPAQRGR